MIKIMGKKLDETSYRPVVRVIEENYQRITDDRHSFDIRFWQSQGDRAIFEAVAEMLHDYLLIRGIDADEFRLQRTVESFRKA